MSAAKLAISVPEELFRSVEKARKRRGLTRSAVVQRGLRAWLAEIEREQQIAAYVASYRLHPETEDEIETSGAIALASMKKRRQK